MAAPLSPAAFVLTAPPLGKRRRREASLTLHSSLLLTHDQAAQPLRDHPPMLAPFHPTAWLRPAARMHNPLDPASFRPTVSPTRAMKTRMLFGIALLLGIFTSAADNFRCVTVAATFGGPATLQIQQGETAELVSSVSTTKNGTGETTFLKSGGGGGGPWGFGIPLIGPATITASASRGNALVITVKITPDPVDVNKADSVDVNKTLILPPGTNQVYVALESSTNLVNWSAATNGFYGSPDTVLFFRVRTNALASP